MPLPLGRTYDACCAPYHQGQREALDPVALMRSRYAASAPLGEAEYLVRTLHEEHADRALPRAELIPLAARRAGSPPLPEPRHPRQPAGRRRGRGALRRRAHRGRRDQSFVELSDFAHDGTGWRYVSGILMPLAEIRRPTEGLTIDAFLALAGGY